MLEGTMWFWWALVLIVVCFGSAMALMSPPLTIRRYGLTARRDLKLLVVLTLGWILMIWPVGIVRWWTWVSLVLLIAAWVVYVVRRNRLNPGKLAAALGVAAAALYLLMPLIYTLFAGGDTDEERGASRGTTRQTEAPAPTTSAAPSTSAAPCEGWELRVLNPDNQLFASGIAYASDREAEDAFRAYLDRIARVDPDNFQLALATYDGIYEDRDLLVNTDFDPDTGCASGFALDAYNDLVDQIPQIINVDEDGCVIVTNFNFEGAPITCSDEDPPAPAPGPAPAPAPAPAPPAPAPGTTRPPAPAPAPAPAPQAPAPPPAAPAPAPQPAPPAPPAPTPPGPIEPNISPPVAGSASVQETAPSGPEQASPGGAPGAGTGAVGGNVSD